MKKIFTFLNIILLVVCLAGTSNAQLSIQNATYYVNGPNDQILTAHATITNNGTGSVTVFVARLQENLASGHMSYFCWTECYAPQVAVSPEGIPLGPGESTSVFNGDLNPLGLDGTSIVSYAFFTTGGDSVFATFNYQATATGINELSSKANLNTASPNPANGYTRISYNLNATKDAKIVVCNMLGSVMKEIKLNDYQNTLTLSTADLKQGIYFYSLIVDGKIISSRRLIISHN